MPSAASTSSHAPRSNNQRSGSMGNTSPEGVTTQGVSTLAFLSLHYAGVQPARSCHSSLDADYNSISCASFRRASNLVAASITCWGVIAFRQARE